MGVEGRDKQKVLEAGTHALAGQLGKTVNCLRKASNLSLSELSEQSGVAKSIISQIERNETNPTLVTLWRLAQALDVSIEQVLREDDDFAFLEKISRNDTPLLVSDDGKCRLGITGWSKTIDWLQWYDFSAEPGRGAGLRRPSPRRDGIAHRARRRIAGGGRRRNRNGGGRRHPALPRRPSAHDPQRRTRPRARANDLHPARGGDGMRTGATWPASRLSLAMIFLRNP